MEEVWKNIDAAIESGTLELSAALKTAKIIHDSFDDCAGVDCIPGMCPAAGPYSGASSNHLCNPFFMASFMQRYSPAEIEAPPEEQSEMIRDSQDGKPRFDLMIPEDVPYEHQMLTRDAMHSMRGAKQYGERNWEKACTLAQLIHFRASAFRHFMQWFCGMTDEDHAAAARWNIKAYEEIKWKMENGQ